MENNINHNKVDEVVKNTLSGFEATYSTADWEKIAVNLEDNASSPNPLSKLNLPEFLKNISESNFVKKINAWYLKILESSFLKKIKISYLVFGVVVVIGVFVLLFSVFNSSEKPKNKEPKAKVVVSNKIISKVTEPVAIPVETKTIIPTKQVFRKDTITIKIKALQPLPTYNPNDGISADKKSADKLVNEKKNKI